MTILNCDLGEAQLKGSILHAMLFFVYSAFNHIYFRYSFRYAS